MLMDSYKNCGEAQRREKTETFYCHLSVQIPSNALKATS